MESFNNWRFATVTAFGCCCFSIIVAIAVVDNCFGNGSATVIIDEAWKINEKEEALGLRSGEVFVVSFIESDFGRVDRNFHSTSKIFFCLNALSSLYESRSCFDEGFGAFLSFFSSQEKMMLMRRSGLHAMY